MLSGGGWKDRRFGVIVVATQESPWCLLAAGLDTLTISAVCMHQSLPGWVRSWVRSYVGVVGSTELVVDLPSRSGNPVPVILEQARRWEARVVALGPRDMACKWVPRLFEAPTVGVVFAVGQAQCRSPGRVGNLWTRVDTVEHRLCGGVTAGSFVVTLVSRSDSNESIRLSSPRRDLRFALKAGEDGHRVRAPEGVTVDPGEAPVWMGRGVVGSWGLVPWTGRPTKGRPRGMEVITAFGPWWVRRRLTTAEWWSVLDIPETLETALTAPEHRDLLVSTCVAPLKVVGVALRLATRLVGKGVKRPRSECEPARSGKDVEVEAGLEGRIRNSGRKRAVSLVAGRVVPGGDAKRGRVTAGASADALLQLTLSELEEEVDHGRSAKATKSDDADVPVYLWDRRVLPHVALQYNRERLDWRRAFALMRSRMIQWWRRRQLRGWIQYRLKRARSRDVSEEERARDRAAARDCLRRIAGVSVWKWDLGSRPIFWNWPEEFRTRVRDGLHVWVNKELLPNWRRPQMGIDPSHLEMVRSKLDVIRSKGYVEPGTVRSLTAYFAVPKGADDIRMVYDGTQSGLNAALWAPYFSLPTVEERLDMIVAGSVLVDNDVGECFHNWVLDERIQPYCGIDLTPVYGEERDGPTGVVWERWTRSAMGLRPSPYTSVRAMLWLAEVRNSIPGDAGNVYRWDRVVLNLPGQADYDPTFPRVSKRRLDGTVAADSIEFVDDETGAAMTRDEAWEVAQRTAKSCAWCGVQDAARKRREESQTGGAWAGSIVHTDGGLVTVLVAKDKWRKTKSIVARILEEARRGGLTPHKQLERDRGFLVYVGQTYPAMVPYFKGIHGTLDSWRPGRTVDGFAGRWNEEEEEEYWADGWEDPWDYGKVGPGTSGRSEEPPEMVRMTSRLLSDAEALSELVRSDEPPPEAGQNRKTLRGLVRLWRRVGPRVRRRVGAAWRRDILPARGVGVFGARRVLIELSGAPEPGGEFGGGRKRRTAARRRGALAVHGQHHGRARVLSRQLQESKPSRAGVENEEVGTRGGHRCAHGACVREENDRVRRGRSLPGRHQ